ncbi:MAG: metallophosphoesterase family protein [Burkholderiales bacterium]
MDEFRLVQVADLHLGAGQEHHLDNWLKVSDWIVRGRPDLVVVNGDLIMGDPDDDADHAFARSRIAQLPVPCRYLPGNHDIGDNVVSGKMAKRVNNERRERFLKHFGEERWAFARAGWGFVGINSQLLGSNGQPAEDEQWTWLEQALTEQKGRPIALFLHKPLFLDHPSEPDHADATLRQSCIDSASRSRLLELCRRHGVRLVSSGHKHQTRSFSLDGIYYLWAPSTACVNSPPTTLHWGVREVGFIDYRFRPGTFDHRIVGRDFLFRHENYIRKYGSASE